MKVQSDLFTPKQSLVSNKSIDRQQLQKQVTFLQSQLENLTIMGQQNEVYLRKKFTIDKQKQRAVSFRVGRIVKNYNKKDSVNNDNCQQYIRQSKTIDIRQIKNNRRMSWLNNDYKQLKSNYLNTPLNSRVGFDVNNSLQQQKSASSMIKIMALSNRQQKQKQTLYLQNKKITLSVNQQKNRVNPIYKQSDQNLLSFISKQSSTNDSSRYNNTRQRGWRFRSRIMSQNNSNKNINSSFSSNLSNFNGKIRKNVPKKINQDQNTLAKFESKLLMIPNEGIPKQQIPNNIFSLSQLPYFIDKPHHKCNKQEIIQLTLRIAKKLAINQQLKLQHLQKIVIKKYKNCLIFKIPQTNKKIIWYYEGKFYYGEGEKEGDQGFKQGYGIQYVPQQTLYKGHYFDNKKHGLGVIITFKGDIYEGQWYQGKYHGKGKYFDLQTKQTYEGEFKQGKFDGLGILKMSDNQIYKGQFVKNIKYGSGVELFKNGDKYQGQYYHGKLNGFGRYIWQNASFYQGEFVMGIRTGYGKWYSSAQQSHSQIYIGMYLNDKKHGYGKYYWPDGSIYEGVFQSDRKHGDGKMIYKDKKIVKGRWENNKLVEVYQSLHKNDMNSQIIENYNQNNDDYDQGSEQIIRVGLQDDDQSSEILN